jgi:Uma2 family endonuclease
MTTKTTRLPYRVRWNIDYAKLGFDPDEPEPWDDLKEYYIAERSFYILGNYLDSIYPPEDVFRGCNSFICYDPANYNVRISPDFYIAIGVDAAAIVERRIYIPEEVGKPPDLALEIASEETAGRDLREKREIYAAIGVLEYWRFDPTGGDYYGYPLAGDRLVNGVYEPVGLTAEPDGVLKGYSSVLGLRLCWQEGLLKFYNPETGLYLTNFAEERAARQAAEADLDRERATRQAAEARIRQLEEELRRGQE